MISTMPGMGEECYVKVVLQNGKTVQGMAQVTEIRMQQPAIKPVLFGSSWTDMPSRTWYMHFEGMRELTTTLNDDDDLLIVEQDTWKETIYWLKRLAWIIGPDFDGTEDLRNTGKQALSFLGKLEAHGLIVERR